MSLPEHIAIHQPLPDAPEIEQGKPSSPGEYFTLLKSLVEERDLCQTAVSTRNEPTTGQPLRRGEHPRYITKLENAQKSLEERLGSYAGRFGDEAAAQMADFVGAVQR